MLVKTNDMHFIIYLSAFIRAIVALHDVVKNKIQYRDHDEYGEEKEEKKGEEVKEKEEKKAEEGKEKGEEAKKK